MWAFRCDDLAYVFAHPACEQVWMTAFRRVHRLLRLAFIGVVSAVEVPVGTGTPEEDRTPSGTEGCLDVPAGGVARPE